MKAMMFDRYGGPEVLSLREIPTPTATSGRVLVRVRAASINDWEWQMIQGEITNRLMAGWFAPKRIRIPGCDIAGEVESVGPGVQAFEVGDRVFGDLSAVGFGAFAEYVSVPPRALARMPDAMSFEQAAAIPQAGMLAVQALVDVGQLEAGQRLLFNGAGGGVGTMGIQLARNIGDVHVTMVDHGNKLDRLRSLGADEVVDYTQQDFTRTGTRWDLIVDAKTSLPPSAYLRALNPGGTYATVGGRLGRLLQLFLRGRMGIPDGRKLRVVALNQNRELDYLSGLFTEGVFAPVIDSVHELEDLPSVMAYYDRAEQVGKIVVRCAT